MVNGCSSSKQCVLFVYLPVLGQEWMVMLLSQLTLRQLAELLCDHFPILNDFWPLYFYDVCHQTYLELEKTLEDLHLSSGILLYLL